VALKVGETKCHLLVLGIVMPMHNRQVSVSHM